MTVSNVSSRRSGKPRFMLGFLALVVLLLAACAADEAADVDDDVAAGEPTTGVADGDDAGDDESDMPAELVPVVLGTVDSITNLPVTVAQARGYFEEEGVDLTVTFFGSGVDIVPALASGDLDLGEGSITPALFNSFGRDIEQPIVMKKAGCGPELDFCPVVVAQSLHDSGEFMTWSDIPGRTIAISNHWTASHYKLALLDEAFDVDPDSYEIINLPFGEMATALETEAIDAAVIIEPIATGVEARGVGTRLLDGDHSPSVAVTYTAANEDFLAEQPDVMVSYLRGYLRGAREVLEAREAFDAGDSSHWHELSELPLVSETYSVLADPDTRDLVSVAEYYGNAEVDLDELEEYKVFYESGDQLTPEGSAVEPTDIVDTGFLELALGALGRW